MTDPIRLAKQGEQAENSRMDAMAEKIPPKWLEDSLERSEAQIEAGQSVPLDPVLDRIRASIDRMQAGPPTPSLRRTRKA